MLCSGLADLQDQQGDSGKTGTLDLSAGTWRQLGGLEDKPLSTAMAPGGQRWHPGLGLGAGEAVLGFEWHV